jgi:hypothetical protein
MPIRPDLRHHYGKAWRATVQLVRERASNRCECTGACGDTHGASHVCLCVVAGDTPGVAHAAPGCKRCAGTGAAPAVCHAPNGVRIVRERDNPAAWALEADVGTWLPVSPFGENKPIRVVLTVAHLNQVAGDDRLENLQLLCQRCHLRLDRHQHARSAKATRRRRNGAELPGIWPKGCLNHDRPGCACEVRAVDGAA